MKTVAALLLLTITSSVFACGDLIGDYVCIDKYSYSYYRNISISNSDNGIIITENGRNRYGRSLKLDGKKSPVENTTIKSSCDGKSIKVTMSLGRYSDTDTYKKTKTGIKFSTREETGKKKLDCEKL